MIADTKNHLFDLRIENCHDQLYIGYIRWLSPP